MLANTVPNEMFFQNGHKKIPPIGGIYIKAILYYAFTLPLLFAITSSAMLFGAGA